jgi:phage gp46-like protein
MTDVHLFHTDDGGEVTITNGTMLMKRVAIEAAAYLSLFGGNENDRGISADDHLSWWGNVGESEERRYRSETQALLRALPLIPASLRKVEGAATRDLEWMVTTGVATDVRATATMPALNTIKLVVEIDVNGETIQLEFEECRCS